MNDINEYTDNPGQAKDYVSEIMNAYIEGRDAQIIFKADMKPEVPALKEGITVTIPYARLRTLSDAALFTGMYGFNKHMNKQSCMSKKGYFLDLMLEFDDDIKNKLIKQHETLAAFFREAKDTLGANEFKVELTIERSAGVYKKFNKDKDFSAAKFGKNIFIMKLEEENVQEFHSAIAEIQFYLLALPKSFISVYYGKYLIAAFNALGMKDDTYMNVGSESVKSDLKLIWKKKGYENMMEKYRKYGEELDKNMITEIGHPIWKHNMHINVLREDFHRQGKMLWFCWQKCVKPTLEEYFKSLKQKIELTLHDLGSPIDFNTDDAYEGDIIGLQKSPFTGTK
ncbi:MAG: hypothetical protein ACTSQP_08195 [Promethearchaeota archaeon]